MEYRKHGLEFNSQSWRDEVSSSTCVFKVGTSVLVSRAVSTYGDKIRASYASFSTLAGQVKFLKDSGTNIVVVSSGAKAFGRMENGVLHKELVDLEELQLSYKRLGIDDYQIEVRLKELKQRATAIGQGVLMNLWRRAFKAKGLLVEQILIDDQNIQEGIQSTRSALRRQELVAIVNGNDALSSERMSKCGNNDKLARLVATGVNAEFLLMISRVCGVLDQKNRMINFLDANSEVAIHDFGRTEGGSGGITLKVYEAQTFGKDGGIAIITDKAGSRLFIKGDHYGTWIYNRQSLQLKGRDKLVDLPYRAYIQMESGMFK